MNLADPITAVKYINSEYAKRLEILGIKTVKDFLTHFPRTYVDSTELTQIIDVLSSLELEKEFTIKAKVISCKSVRIRGGRSIQNVLVEDETGELKLGFFNQPFLSRVFKEDKIFLINGKVVVKGKQIQMYPKNYEEVLESKENVHLGRISPEYHLTAGVTKKWFRNRMYFLTEEIKNSRLKIKNELANSEFVIRNIVEVHFPSSEETLKKAVETLSMLELVSIHLKILKNRKKEKVRNIPKVSVNRAELNKFIEELPFELSKDQRQVISDFEFRISKGDLVNSLLQGDVGTGKTIVAVTLALIIARNGYQTIILAPTTVLARQHFETFLKFLKGLDVSVELISSETKTQTSADILIGTSAILARKERIVKNPGLIIVDEQHRFGVHQREELLKEAKLDDESTTPHFINMTATPIPRTIAETFFSDLDVQTIKTKPKDRKPIKSFIVPDEKRADGYKWIEENITSKNIQAFWICPLVEESIALEVKSVKKTFEEVKQNIKKAKVELLHGKMKPKEKSSVMKNFEDAKSDILVSTTVIEVGIDVPNANIIVIENAERFGLAQLHQIRGRVGRGTEQSYCFLFTGDEINETARQRLDFFSKHLDGLEIAEYDLMQRGPGEVYGEKQAGIPNLKIAKLNDLSLIKKSKEIATKAYNNGIKSISLFS